MSLFKYAYLYVHPARLYQMCQAFGSLKGEILQIFDS